MRHRKRLFIAIDISQEARDFFKSFKDRLYDFPARWNSPEGLHLTLSFLGNVKEEDVPILVEKIETVVEDQSPFFLTIETVDFDVTKKIKHPRMIWAKVGESEGLSQLYNDMTNMLISLPFSVHSQRPLISPHITLCRFNSFSFRNWHSDELPDIKEEVDISFPVENIHLMESKLRRGGPEYFVLQSFSLGA